MGNEPRAGTAARLIAMEPTLDDALNTTVNRQRLGDLRPPALRILKLWCTNKLNAAPDDPQLVLLEQKIEMVLKFRIANPLPHPFRAPGFDPPFAA